MSKHVHQGIRTREGLHAGLTATLPTRLNNRLNAARPRLLCKGCPCGLRQERCMQFKGQAARMDQRAIGRALPVCFALRLKSRTPQRRNRPFRI